ncbi:MAG: aminotransferase class III-fold pyridoxal phosphate-dependent enzyme [Bdellovibrionota bacterium]
MNANFLEISQQIAAALQGCDGIRRPDPARAEKSQEAIKKMGELRGRPLLYPMMPTGRGSGPFIELMDGSVKMDLITGIGVSLFGYNHPKLMLEAVKCAFRAPVMQGTLMPGREAMRLSELLIKGARGELKGQEHLADAAKAPIHQTWLSSCGTMANELSMKIVRQKKSPAYKFIAIKNCFAGRSSTMGELTDEPKYREGQPTFDQFQHIDFFEESLGVEESVARTKKQIDQIMDKEPGLFAGFVFEPVQGEGGAFRQAPRDWWVPVLEHAKSRGLAIWMDEVQTFARTGELFAFQRLELGRYVDVVSVAKPLHAAAVLWTEAYTPKPGLVAGTFSTSGGNLATGAKVLEMLTEDGFIGPEGRIQRLERFIVRDWNERRERIGAKHNLGRMNILGGMVAMELLDGKAETIKKLLDLLFVKGIIGFNAGKSPVCLRFLPPMGVLQEDHWLQAMKILEECLEELSNVQSP